ncbi:MAG TPA: hypothetical protein VEH01_04250 [Nitrososphaerales archaeon]|nr:hypothetical protein [Nitrososphaerales archaeon]
MGGTIRTGVLPRVATAILELFIAAVVVALAITLSSVSPGVQAIASAAVVPIILVSLILLHYCRRRRPWSFASASALGALGVALRLAVSTQPSLEVGGGLPPIVSALYVTLGALTSLSSFVAFLELRGSKPGTSPESS